MKIRTKYLWWLLPVGIILVVYAMIDVSKPSDLYKLTAGYYLNRIDYFSQYDVVMQKNGKYETAVQNITDLYTFSSGTLLKAKSNSGEMIFYLSNSMENIELINKVNESTIPVDLSEINWKKPWQFVETSTIGDRTKTIIQILLIASIVLIAYIVMKIFDIKEIQFSQSTVNRKFF